MDPYRLLLETERLTLRMYKLGDLDDLFSILGDAETMRYYPRPYTREDTLAWIEDCLDRYGRDGFGHLAVLLKETGELVGNCGLAVRLADGREEVEIGWHVRRSHWGLGIAPEAAGACRDYAFGPLGLERLISLVRPVNHPSRRVAEKIGMSVEKEIDYHEYRHLVYVVKRPTAARTTEPRP
ncbi:MAG: GNAT family N-acetyltransferase [Actinomycetota bacterium]